MSRKPATLLILLGVAASALQSLPAKADDAEIARGKYLVTISGCNDCHTPGYFFGKPDMARFLGGSDVGFEIPGLGVFVGPNLTPDPDRARRLDQRADRNGATDRRAAGRA